jgi:hypothetical protein
MDGDKNPLWWDFKEAPNENESAYTGGEFKGVTWGKKNPKDMNLDELMNEMMTIRSYYMTLVGVNKWSGRLASPTTWEYIWENRDKIMNKNDIQRLIDLQNEYNKKTMQLYSYIQSNAVEKVKKMMEKSQKDSRPPKSGWDRCIRAVSDWADDPNATCGAIYFNPDSFKPGTNVGRELKKKFWGTATATASENENLDLTDEEIEAITSFNINNSLSEEKSMKKKKIKGEVMPNPKLPPKPARSLDYPKVREKVDDNTPSEDLLGNTPGKKYIQSAGKKLMKGSYELETSDVEAPTRYKEKEAPYNPAKTELVPARKSMRIEKSAKGYKIRFEAEDNYREIEDPANPARTILIPASKKREKSQIQDIPPQKVSPAIDVPKPSEDMPPIERPKASKSKEPKAGAPDVPTYKASKKMEKSANYIIGNLTTKEVEKVLGILSDEGVDDYSIKGNSIEINENLSSKAVDRIRKEVGDVVERIKETSSLYGDEPKKLSTNIPRDISEKIEYAAYCDKCKKEFSVTELKYGRCPSCNAMAVLREKAVSGPELLDKKDIDKVGKSGTGGLGAKVGDEEIDVRGKVKNSEPPENYPSNQFLGKPRTETSDKEIVSVSPVSDEELKKKLTYKDDRTYKEVSTMVKYLQKTRIKYNPIEVAQFLHKQKYTSSIVKMMAEAVEDGIITPEELQEKLEESGFIPGFKGETIVKADEDILSKFSPQEIKEMEKKGEKLISSIDEKSQKHSPEEIKKVLKFGDKLKGKPGITNPYALAWYLYSKNYDIGTE